jgi:phage/plasmid-like protein (TIGR03299 family)
MNKAEALSLSGLSGWNLQKLQAWVDFNGERLLTDSFAIVRGDTNKVLGTVGNRYQIMTNEDSFDFLDNIVDGVNTKYETAGAIGDGQKVWLLVKHPGCVEVVTGDALDQYIMFSNTHDGSGSIRVFPTSVRAVCQNTYRIALGDAKRGISMRHTTNVKSKIKAAQEVLGLSHRSHEEFLQTAKKLASAPMQQPLPYFSGILDHIVDTTVAGVQATAANIDNGSLLKAIVDLKTSEARMAEEARLANTVSRRKELLDDILARYDTDRCNGNPLIAGTGWAAVNAVSESVDHSPLYSYRGSTRERGENRLLSIMTGQANEITQLAIGNALAMAN